jgi:FdhD protein
MGRPPACSLDLAATEFSVGESVSHALRQRVDLLLGGQLQEIPIWRPGRLDAERDTVAVEAPVEVRLAGRAIATFTRTPGDDYRLALGFLFGEGLLESAAEVVRVRRPVRPGRPGHDHVIDVVLADGQAGERMRGRRARQRALARAARHGGERVIAELLAGSAPLPPGPTVTADQVSRAVAEMAARQPGFAASGAMHAAGLWSPDGRLVAVCEDVGRHNALDKIVGALLLERAAGRVPEPSLLTFSGRVGAEIAVKVARARVPVVAAVSAPSSFSVRLAAEAGLTLAGFVRGGRMNVYTHPERITPSCAGSA